MHYTHMSDPELLTPIWHELTTVGREYFCPILEDAYHGATTRPVPSCFNSQLSGYGMIDAIRHPQLHIPNRKCHQCPVCVTHSCINE